ncbi:ATP-dependent DNA helicase RecG [Aequitasia blattaphilus]|uniref:DNA binding domain-containing protein n=1 Tax=Aequitasia blattaphilus TaxID=2949332 RepID=A0ABT1ECQ9_9FIRM|nr:ATP-binding protein [Aequitasia blattaphilus]MCP1103619.1 putative DNA binding domain-containing protein [Aequitasia blattaphilus]MCR8616259.1 putative DNA binding domain-containing protein [Aequitasia blattaphilus]
MMKRETKNLEYKEDISNTFLKTVSAYANYGEGKIIFGINDEGIVVGLEGDLEQVCLNIENKINDSLKPTPKYDLEIRKKEKLVELQVYEGENKPFLYRNKAYRRADSATVEVDRLEYNRLILEGINRDYEELPSNNQSLKFQRFEAEMVKKLDISRLSEDIMKTLNLYSNRNGYNKAAELLADRNDYLGLDIVRFGNNIDEFRERVSLDNISVLEQYEKAVQMYRKYYQYEIVDGVERQIVEKIPEKAFREVLANSIVHREWDINSSIRILMHEDKIEIASPGGLPTELSKEEYLNGQISILRNPILGNIFFRLGYIEKFGTGIRRINQAYEQSIMKPKYSVFENSLLVVLPIFSKKIEMLKFTEQQIYSLLQEHQELTRLEIEEKTDMNKDKVIRILNGLIKKTIIKKVGVGKGTRYRLI